MQHKIQVMVSIICMAVIFIAVCVILASNVKAYDGEPIRTNRQESLHQQADALRMLGYADDSPEIAALSAEWWQQQEDLDIIAKVVAHEADPQWCDWEHSIAVAVVILNRVACPNFKGDTVKEIVAAPGQYLESYTRNFAKTPRLCYEVAKAALDGDHDIPPDCYWQDTHRQGVSVWREFTVDTGYFRSTTYICRGIPGVA